MTALWRSVATDRYAMQQCLASPNVGNILLFFTTNYAQNVIASGVDTYSENLCVFDSITVTV